MNSKNKGNIVLVGMPGAGKSTLGVLLAKTLGKNFIDTDLIIQHRENRLLQDIIDNDGVDEFLRIEEEVLCSLRLENSVIATGGSAVYSDKAMNYLKKDAKVVYISVDFDELKRRLTNITTRGIAVKRGTTLEDMFNERRVLYEKYCDVKIDCTKEDIEKSVEKIANSLSE